MAGSEKGSASRPGSRKNKRVMKNCKIVIISQQCEIHSPPGRRGTIDPFSFPLASPLLFAAAQAESVIPAQPILAVSGKPASVFLRITGFFCGFTAVDIAILERSGITTEIVNRARGRRGWRRRRARGFRPRAQTGGRNTTGEKRGHENQRDQPHRHFFLLDHFSR